MSKPTGITHYSVSAQGARGNYQQEARFDWTDGYLGIVQSGGPRNLDRILLSPSQVRALIAFVKRWGWSARLSARRRT